MRCITSFFVLFVVMAVLLEFTVPASAVVVTFPDAELEAAVRTELGIPTDPITDTDMATLESLYASGDIYSIAGLEYATTMNILFLDGNWISDISPISGLTSLSYLSLNFNQISDISPVSGLTNLIQLQLGNNQISDISAVAGMTNLTSLTLSSNRISDISPISGLTNLIALYVNRNQISDISAVAGMTNLIDLYLNINQIEVMDIMNFDPTSMERFDIAGNPLTSVLLVDVILSQTSFNLLMDGGSSYRTGIAELGGVMNLNMSGVDFTDISDLSLMYSMDDLVQLSFAGATNIADNDVVTLTVELDSLSWLNVAGLWDSFDAGSQSSLNTWDDIIGNTLVALFGDANGDGIVNVSDLGTLATNYGQGNGYEWSDGDFTGNGVVDVSDLGILASNYGNSVSAISSVPEPGSITLLLCGLSIIFCIRRG